ncbi:type II toxin-antitoxin system ParD family antitoxin [Hyphomicrobium sp. B1]|uniref:type II toxin-antitoxin system ParD family antitoxin n=1 Tax=Hyphomicrobium sp. B1 TaxID=3075651 RepID=UPI003C2EB43E
MNLSLGKHWDEYLSDLVASGYYASASEAVRDGLRLLLAEETKLAQLREKLNAAIALGGEHSPDDVEAAVQRRLEAWDAKRTQG